MSAYLRPRLSGCKLFFTVCLAERGGSLLTDEILRLRQAMRATRAERPFQIDAMVVLPDHLHAIWTLPEGDTDYSTRWGAIKARFTRGLADGRKRRSHELRREKGIWQRRFWEHHIRGEGDYEAHLRYCWGNPVKHGYVARAVDWRFSSIHRDIRLGLVEREWAGDVPEEEFGEMVS